MASTKLRVDIPGDLIQDALTRLHDMKIEVNSHAYGNSEKANLSRNWSNKLDEIEKRIIVSETLNNHPYVQTYVEQRNELLAKEKKAKKPVTISRNTELIKKLNNDILHAFESFPEMSEIIESASRYRNESGDIVEAILLHDNKVIFDTQRK